MMLPSFYERQGIDRMLRENNIAMGCSYWDAWKDVFYDDEE
jgi:hypothetical protein